MMERINELDKGYCEIRVKGTLEPHWVEWFDLLDVSLDGHTTKISGVVPDQAALRGLMEKMSMLGMTIISIDFRSTDLNGDHNDTITPRS